MKIAILAALWLVGWAARAASGRGERVLATGP